MHLLWNSRSWGRLGSEDSWIKAEKAGKQRRPKGRWESSATPPHFLSKSTAIRSPGEWSCWAEATLPWDQLQSDGLTLLGVETGSWIQTDRMEHKSNFPSCLNSEAQYLKINSWNGALVITVFIFHFELAYETLGCLVYRVQLVTGRCSVPTLPWGPPKKALKLKC